MLYGIILSIGVKQIGAYNSDANGVFTVKGLNTGVYRALELGTARIWIIEVDGATYNSYILSEEGDRINAGFSFGGIS